MYINIADFGESPDELQQVMLPLMDRDVCSAPDWYGTMVTQGMMCLGYGEGGRAACNVSSQLNILY